MTAPVFVDTNVFVYCFDSSDLAKQLRAKAWIDYLWSSRLGRISNQVQLELYTTLTRKLKMNRDEARSVVSALQAWEPIATRFEVAQQAWQLEDSHSLSWWDALIVAAAQVAGAKTLLTEDLQSDAIYGAVRVANPFEQSRPERAVHEAEPEPYW